MEIKREITSCEAEAEIVRQIFYGALGKLVWKSLEKEKIAFSINMNSEMCEILNSIAEVLHDDMLSDFDKIEEIVQIFTLHNLDTGNCHDF